MPKLYYKTNIPGKGSLKPEVNLNEYYSKRQTLFFDADMFEEAWLNNLNSLGWSFRSGFIFFLPPNWTFPAAHTDHNILEQDNNIFALNWMVYGKASEMVWYKPNAEPTHLKNRFGGIQSMWSYDCLEPIDRTIIDDENYMIVRTDIPHTVFTTTHPRLVISIRFMKTPPWDEQVLDLANRGVISL